jgi:hypothetical protein
VRLSTICLPLGVTSIVGVSSATLSFAFAQRREARHCIKVVTQDLGSDFLLMRQPAQFEVTFEGDSMFFRLKEHWVCARPDQTSGLTAGNNHLIVIRSNGL